MSEAKIGDDLAVAFEVCPLEVVQQPPTLANHLQQALPAVMVFRMSAKVLGEVVDVLRENCNLYLGRAGVCVVGAELLDRRGLLECHCSCDLRARCALVSLESS